MSNPQLHSKKPLRVFVLFSGNATAIQYLRRMDPEYNYSYAIVGALTTNKTAPGSTFFIKHTHDIDNTTHRSPKKESIPCEILDWRMFESTHMDTKRHEYFRKLLQILTVYDFDIIACSGFHLRIPDFFIRGLSPKKIINTHPTDLSIINPSTQKRWFVGLWKEAIQLVLDAGMTESCSTAHYITAGVDIDGGEIIAQSRPFRLVPNESVVQVQERLTRIGSDGEALANALKIICSEERREVMAA